MNHLTLPEHALLYLEPMEGATGFQEWGPKLWYFTHNISLITTMVWAASKYTDAVREHHPGGPYEQFDGVKRVRGAFLAAGQQINTITHWYYFDGGIYMWAERLMDEAVCLDPKKWPEMAVLDPHWPPFRLGKAMPGSLYGPIPPGTPTLESGA